jgi:dGTPase
MIYHREELEDLEDRALAPYGFRSRDSRGREHPEDEPAYRTAFQRDRDRILHTTAFRRLEYKTQVFVYYEGDYYRTRLTHTLEVAQIGRTIARALGGNEDLIEAICLAHDLGHPPFGHAGEAALARLMKDDNGFDHNRQSLRIVTELERRYPEYPGLNLTWEVREGIVKHETEYDRSEARDFEPEKRGHLEAQIANVADELAYTAHDLDDGLRSGIITAAQMNGIIELWDRLRDSTHWHEGELDELTRHRLIRRLIGIEVTDLVQSTAERIAAQAVDSVEAVRSRPANVVAFSAALERMNRQLKDFLYQNMYRHQRVVRMQVKAERVIGELFQAYCDGPDMLPQEVRRRSEQVGLPRAVCDYIAGMTDRYALQEHSRLFELDIRP